MNAKLVALLMCLATPLMGQGFAGLGSDAEGFAQPQPNPQFSFPADHGPHPEFRIEWWYLTANLMGDDGRDYGVQWTLFRSALASEPGDGWSAPQLWMGHAALTTPDQHLFDERLARGGIGQAGVQAAPFEAFIDDWHLSGANLSDFTAYAQGRDFAYALDLRANGPLVFHGQGGYSVKSDTGQASYYYAQPWLKVNGVLSVAGREVQVTGQAWLDREWSSQPLADNQEGWDWFSLHLDDGRKLMAFQLREGPLERFISGSLIEQDGTLTTLSRDDITLTPEKSDSAPTRWRLALPKHDIAVTVEALNPDSWMDTTVRYWEGPVRFDGTHNGRGYLEMTGY